MKKIISAAVSAVMCVSVTAAANVFAVTADLSGVPAVENRVSESGVCSATTSWNYEDGKLTITGTGDMVDWEMSYNAPWNKFKPDIISVEIAEGVTNIGACAFAGCTSLTTFNIPSTVTYIGRGAFESCSQIKSVDIPENVTLICADAFKNCSSLRTVRIFNSKCEIVGDSSTICNRTSGGSGSYSGVISGYRGSTANEYASESHYSFTVLSGSYQPSTSPVATTTTTTTTSTTTTTKKTTTTSTNTTTTTAKKTTTTVTTATQPVTNPELVISFGMSKNVLNVGEAADVYTNGYTIARAESSDPSVAIAEGRMIKAVGPGSATITYYTSEGYKTELTVTVNGSANSGYNLGDVDNNGAVNAVDASFVLGEYAYYGVNRTWSFSGDKFTAADVDDNGMINAVDASYILSYYAYSSTGTGEKLPIEDYLKQN